MRQALLKVFVLVMLAAPLLFSVQPASAAGKKVLFDQGHGQTAGNADWTITGGYSDFANALRNNGYIVESTTSRITSSLLANYDVIVIPEPNINFTSEEKFAIDEFVYDGGGVYFIADHYNSDRNNDGWDSVEIFNGYQNGQYDYYGDWVGYTYGFTFEPNWYSQDPITNIKSTPFTSGINSVGMWGGTTIKLTGDNPNAYGTIYSSKDTDPYHVHGSFGYGRFAAIGDSSPFDDGTGAPGDSLHPNWYDYDHRTLGPQAVEWLAGDR
jgi:hypothetical protein